MNLINSNCTNRVGYWISFITNLNAQKIPCLLSFEILKKSLSFYSEGQYITVKMCFITTIVLSVVMSIFSVYLTS